VFNVLGLVFSV